ncbi:hypothetical protein EFO83_14210 [Lacticaseibacillus rhamnosus]|uniref:hypothetical protein n=1 Tax=Lacticaseibacillus rhamnosus TaxID=47715 RepID=UPI0021A68D77|nr:hypothetical protein [Lacticaseibacillus rhamnosus]MCT3193117.1 hypothetical protein [Lacticaseibacillus rhamnosus]MCT3373773.1 hypothetical protein [Lacticaseibacillus rhamnosus]
MNKVFDKLKPIFEAIAANKYVSAIRDGFIACMPIIIFSSIFMMIAYVPKKLFEVSIDEQAGSL